MTIFYLLYIFSNSSLASEIINGFSRVTSPHNMHNENKSISSPILMKRDQKKKHKNPNDLNVRLRSLFSVSDVLFSIPLCSCLPSYSDSVCSRWPKIHSTITGFSFLLHFVSSLYKIKQKCKEKKTITRNCALTI